MMTGMLPLFDQPSTQLTVSKKRCILNDQQIAAKCEECWGVRPKRLGSNPKTTFVKKFTALVKSGENPDLIIAGVRQLRDYYANESEDRRRFIPMMATIFNQERWRGAPDDMGHATSSGPDNGGSGFMDIAVELGYGAGHRNDPDPTSGGGIR